MNKYRVGMSSILYRVSFIGLLIISLIGFFFFTKSAEMQSVSVSAEQNPVLGKLAYATLTGTFGGPILGIRTASAALQT